MIGNQVAKSDDMLYGKYRMTAESVAARRIEDKISMKRLAQGLGKRS